MPSNLLEETLNPTEREVLDVIWRLGPVSRQEISERTGMTAMTVSRVARALAQRALVSDEPNRTGSRGNPTRPLSIEANAGFSVGVNFTQTTAELGLIDLCGAVRHYESFSSDGLDLAGLILQVRDALDRAAARDPDRFARRKLIGVGFALPGDFAARGRVLAAHPLFAGLRDRDLAEECAAGMDAPVYVNSDSNSAAVGERLLGAGRTLSSFLFVHLGHGVGGGLVLEGRPYFGVNMNAGILGNHFPTDKPRPSGLDYIETLRAAGHDITDFADLERIDPFSLPETRPWIKRAGAQLRDKLNYAVKLVDPQVVIIGGRLPDRIHHALAAEIDQPDFCITCDMDRLLPRPRVVGSLLGSRAGVIGAAALPLHDLLFHAGSGAVR